MRVVDCVQGSPEWLAARAGHVTSSRIADVMAKIKSGEAAGRRNYRAELVAEILTGMPAADGYKSGDMLRGNETEPLARAAYEVRSGQFVDQVGFILHPSLERCGASPDGLVGDDGLIEIKCPKTATHLEYLLSGSIPGEYQLQMLWQMECCERAWCDFVSFDPRLPEHLQLVIRRMERDEPRLREIRFEVLRFLAGVEDLLASLPQAAEAMEVTR